MDSKEIHEFRLKLAEKLAKMKKELAKLNNEPADKRNKHLVRDHAYVEKLQHFKEKLEGELEFMRCKDVVLSEGMVEALWYDKKIQLSDVMISTTSDIAEN
ncbi:CiV19.5g2-like-4 protein [Chelonus insularis]|nr:CiV19.5g2-like-4 protein [Chelonus insularis]